jgi:hypothetical protein
MRAGLLIALVVVSAVVSQERKEERKYSPLGYYDLRAYEQAYPGDPASPLVQKVTAGKYWAFQGLAYRQTQVQGAVWTSLGPETSIQSAASGSSENISGRVSALAISPLCLEKGACRLWVGTAGGGVWRTDDAMHPTDPKWRWVSRGIGTNSIGSLALDPNDRTGNTIFVGTGETNQPNNSGAGTGLYRSTDGGDSWTRISTNVIDPVLSPAPIDFTSTRGISTVVIEPGNSQTMYVATTSAMLGMTGVRGGQTQTTGYLQPRTGLYKTENGGLTWTLAWVPPLPPVVPANPNLGEGVGDTMFGVRHVELDPKNPKIVYATAWNNAIHRSAPSLEGGDASFKPVYTIVNAARFRDLAMFDVTQINGQTRLYVYNGTDSTADQALYRLDNANVPASSLVTVSNGIMVNTSAWTRMTSADTSHPSSTSRAVCSTQCFYDLAVATPDAEPDTVYLGGVATPTFGEPTIRSTNGGAAFTAFGSDAQTPQNFAHVDVRSIVFHPRNPSIVFVGSDGGLVRSDGTFENITNRCAALFNNAPHCQTVLASVPTRLFFMNKGLQTLQFYNIALDPKAPLTRLIGGLQDNSTIWRDGTGDPRVWKTLFAFGDGTSASGFHPSRSEVLFASFQSNRFFTNFRNGDPNNWVRTDAPILAAGERNTVTNSTGRQFITFDSVNPNSQFTGFQHIWRTQNNGGAQAALEATCRFPAQSGNSTCGDWLPLGVPYPFVAGTTPSSASRKPGDLTSDFYGADRAGGIIVAAERARSDAGTLWAATNFGRLFVSTNANAAGSAVTFSRIDTPMMPNRFVTRIVVHPANPNVAFISYSGFNAITPNTPGHIFRADFDPATGRAVFASQDFDLGDIPINTIAFDDLRGDMYAGTDFGPLILRRFTGKWELAGIGFPEALMVDFEIVPEQRLLVVATHGLGIFYLTLPKIE